MFKIGIKLDIGAKFLIISNINVFDFVSDFHILFYSDDKPYLIF